MKERMKISLAKKITVCLLILMAISITADLFLFIVSVKNNVDKAITILSVLLGGLITVAVCYFYYGIVVPYRKTKKILLQFNAGITLDELFKIKHLLYKDMDETLAKFSEMLKREDAIKASKKHAEYLALQNQINPHFLYNTLEAIRGDALSEGATGIAQTTEALAAFFRYTISNVNNLVTLEDELGNVESYFIIQQYRFGEKLNMEIDYDRQDKKILEYLLPKLTLQPIIENAIYHGLECKISSGTVKIRIQTTKSRLLINIVDDGVGINEKRLEKLNKQLTDPTTPMSNEEDKRKKGGIALVNVNHRIHLLFGEEYGLRVSSSINLGTDVELTLPLITEESDVNV